VRVDRYSQWHGQRLARVVDEMQARGLIDASGWLSDAGRKTKEQIESLTDDLAAPAYASLEPSELGQLIADLEPITATLDAAGSRKPALTRKARADSGVLLPGSDVRDLWAKNHPVQPAADHRAAHQRHRPRARTSCSRTSCRRRET